MNELPVYVARLTSVEFARVTGGDAPVCILLPVGAVEPHGPHLALDTDLTISRAAAERAVPALRARGIVAFVAPDVPYGVTECARDFAGAASVPQPAVEAYLAGVIGGWQRAGARHVCLVNNHLEPAHDAAVRAAVAACDPAGASVASPLTRRFARTLSDEFRRGACHAGEYETSIVLAAAPESVREEISRMLPDVDVSLSDNLARGVDRFVAMGMRDGYAGSPARASAAHGDEMLARLAAMIVTTVEEAVAAA
ncbi:MAG TPA: creatininase family protein [Candidatus Krumholzibacteria bacterium]|nr:creatininase family protein [Candidatus Krumholzibacteria bacterium]